MNRTLSRRAVRALSLLLCAVMVLALLPAAGVRAVNAQCVTYIGTNAGSQSYRTYASAIDSYLTCTPDGQLMRLQSNALEDQYLVEYYDTAYNYLRTVTVGQELPIFGGFYAGGSHYYILTGQTNFDESADVECFRITKYDRDWNRLGSCGLYDCNTTTPFRAGSARFAISGKYLLIRTAHEMYADSNGVNHQANVTIQVDTDAMTVTDSFTGVRNISYGYVSHSFNQFIHIADNRIVALDHGDAYPRSLVLTQYQTDISTGSFTPAYSTLCQAVSLATFPGKTGQNYTGASVGGFELSDTAYLAAYNSVAQDDSFTKNTTRNIFVAALDKSTMTVTQHQITHLAEGEPTASTPHLVKLSSNSFLLLWSQENDVFYTLLDGSGKVSGKIYTMEDAALSDCVPAVAGSKAVWYTWRNGTTTFYDIDLSAPANASKTVIENGHRFGVDAYPQAPGGNCTVTCSQCGLTETFPTCTGLFAWWVYADSEYDYSSMPDTRYDVGQTIKVMIDDYPNEMDYNDKVVTVSDPSAMELTETHYGYALSFTKPGIYQVTISYLYNPQVSRTYTVTVAHTDGDGDQLCDGCGGLHAAYDVAQYRAAQPYTAPTREGYVFAGWYTDETMTQPLDKAVKTGRAYAKFVPERVLSVKWQVSAGTNAATESTTVRLVTTVDSLDYGSVGFKFRIGTGKWNTRTSTTVYSQIRSNTEGVVFNYKPTVFHETSRYFLTRTVTGVPSAYYDTPWTVIPFWVTLDGTTVEGVSRTFRVSDFYNR